MKQIRRMLALLLTVCVLLGTCGALADTYREGDAGPEIMALKERMLELGYYSGTISHNRFNDTMTERVKQLQKVNGLEQTGIVDEELYAFIMSDAVLQKNGKKVAADTPTASSDDAATQEPEPTATPEPAGGKVLYREGNSGKDIMKIKERLLALGYYTGNIANNAFNDAMTERIKQLQKNNGLEQTGVINEALYELIFSSNVNAKNGYPLGTLVQGDTGNKVKQLRERLVELKYLSSAGGSEFNKTLTDRIKLVQRMNGFEVTGTVSPELYDYIMSSACKVCGEHVKAQYNASYRFNYELNGDKLYSVSQNGNVIIFIIDYFANNYLNGVLRSYPHMLDDFKDFTYYSNCDPRYIGTYPSVTHMLTGNTFDPSLLVGEYFEQSWTSETAEYIYDTIHSLGWEFRYYYYTSISDGALDWAMGKVDNLVDRRANPQTPITPIYSYTDFFDHLKAQGLTVDQTEKKYIQMIHLRGAHAPYSSNAKGEYKKDATREENIAGYMAMVADYMERLKAAGLYDDATIIVTADHGDKGENMQVVYWIKQPNEHHDAVQTTGAPISHTDFPGTILSLIGGDYSQYGTSIFDWHDGDKRERSCSVVSRDVDMYPLVSCYSDLGLGSHNYWRTYTYTGTGKDLMKKNKSGSYKYEPLAQSFN